MLDEMLMLSTRLSLQHGTSSGCWRMRQPPDMEGDCEYTE